MNMLISIKYIKFLFILFLSSFCIHAFADDIEKGLSLFKKQQYEKALPEIIPMFRQLWDICTGKG